MIKVLLYSLSCSTKKYKILKQNWISQTWSLCSFRMSLKFFDLSNRTIMHFLQSNLTWKNWSQGQDKDWKYKCKVFESFQNKWTGWTCIMQNQIYILFFGIKLFCLIFKCHFIPLATWKTFPRCYKITNKNNNSNLAPILTPSTPIK